VKTLLEMFIKYFGFLYLSPNYGITNSTTSGSATANASLTLTGPVISWDLSIDRGEVGIGIAPTRFASSPDNWFRLSLVRQYLDGYDDTIAVPLVETVTWIRDNLRRLDELFSDATVVRSCEELLALANSLATKYFGPPKS
jgi:hypothetical protein